jgi:hypothetical protein
MARPKETNKRQLKGRSKNSLEQVLEWIKSNPGDAALLLAESVGMDPRPPWMREKQSKEDLASEAGLLAAGAVPGGGALRLGAKASKAAKKAREASTAAEKAAGMAKPKTTAPRAGGSGTGQKPGGSNRLTPSERAARRKGEQKAKTEQGAKKLEKQDAAQSSTKSVNTGKASPVQIREGAEGPKLPSGVTDAKIKAFGRNREKNFTKPRTAAERKQAAEETKKRLDIARRMREEGRRPGDDVPDAAGNLPVGNPVKTSSAKPKTVKPKESQKAADRKKFTEKVKRDKAVKARKEQIEKDVREGRRQSVTDPRSYPSKGKGAEGPRASQGLVPTGRGSTTRESTGRRIPGNLPAARPGSEVVQGRVIRGGRNQREPIDMKTRPMGGSGQGAGRGGGQVPRAIGPGASSAGKAGGKTTGRGKKALLGLGALGAAGLVAKQFDSDKAPSSSDKVSNNPSTTPKPKPKSRPTLRDKYGRDITREEFAKRKAYRQRTQSMSAEEAAKARKKEMKRRKQYRSGAGSERFGSGAATKTRNIRNRPGYAYMDMAARRNMR